MDGVLNEKMKAILADPNAMAQVMEMAGKLFAGGAEEGSGVSSLPDLSAALAKQPAVQEQTEREQESTDDDASERSRAVLGRAEGTERAGGRGGFGTEEDRIRLLHAICPFLSAQRREAAQSMIRILKLISMADAAGLWKSR